jgi:hypothetical protein
MSQFNEALLFNKAADLGAARFGNVSNIEAGAQLGIGPRILQIDAATPLIFNPAIIVMLTAPTMWDGYPIAKTVLKSLFEMHAKSISGISFGYTLNFADTPNGHDGQVLSMPTNSQRTQVSPSFTWPEIYGNIVWNLHYKWIMDIQHPDTQVSQLATSITDENMPPWLLSTISASFIAIQPDPTGVPDRIIDAAVYTAVMPTETGDLGIKREINSAEHHERSITYKALVQHNDNTRELGRIVLKAMNAHKPDFQRASTQKGIESSLAGQGMDKEVQEALRDYQLLA